MAVSSYSRSGARAPAHEKANELGSVPDISPGRATSVRIVPIAVGLAGAVFNCVGNIAGIVTPIVFGYIVAATGSYGVGLWFVGAAHCVVAALLFLFVMGKIERVGECSRRDGR